MFLCCSSKERINKINFSQEDDAWRRLCYILKHTKSVLTGKHNFCLLRISAGPYTILSVILWVDWNCNFCLLLSFYQQRMISFWALMHVQRRFTCRITGITLTSFMWCSLVFTKRWQINTFTLVYWKYFVLLLVSLDLKPGIRVNSSESPFRVICNFWPYCH